MSFIDFLRFMKLTNCFIALDDNQDGLVHSFNLRDNYKTCFPMPLYSAEVQQLQWVNLNKLACYFPE